MRHNEASLFQRVFPCAQMAGREVQSRDMSAFVDSHSTICNDVSI